MADTVDDTQVPLDPLINLLHLRHTAASPHTSNEEKAAAKDMITSEINAHDMRHYYQLVSELFGWDYDAAKGESMDARNDAIIAKLDEKLKDAQDNLGDTEIRDVLQAKCDHYARIGDVENALKLNDECLQKTLGAGPKLDLCFQRVRLGIAFGDNDVSAKGIQEGHKLIKGGDWERRNRLKVYEGLYLVFVRDFQQGSALLIDCLSTFAATELLPFKQFIFITVVTSLATLSRQDLRKKIIDSPEVVSANLTELNDLITAIYSCRYKQVMPALEQVCIASRRLVYLTAHIHYFFREVRARVFNQFLDSYSSVTLSSMSNAFGIPLSVLDNMLTTLICNERVSCKIDRVSGSVTTFRGDTTNFDYHRVIKSSDLLLNRVQKLSRMVEMQ